MTEPDLLTSSFSVRERTPQASPITLQSALAIILQARSFCTVATSEMWMLPSFEDVDAKSVEVLPKFDCFQNRDVGDKVHSLSPGLRVESLPPFSPP